MNSSRSSQVLRRSEHALPFKQAMLVCVALKAVHFVVPLEQLGGQAE
jgi:hypothetical protein